MITSIKGFKVGDEVFIFSCGFRVSDLLGVTEVFSDGVKLEGGRYISYSGTDYIMLVSEYLSLRPSDIQSLGGK